jgi:hypothetical protein
MNSSRCPHFRTRAAVSLIVAGVWVALLSCSSDPASTLGSDSDVLGSEPGTVYQDTIGVFGDTTFAFHTPIATDTDLELGRDDGYERIMILQPGFAELDAHAGDLTRTVSSASLHMFTAHVMTSFPVRFYRLERKYTEGDTISVAPALPDSLAIPDPGAGGSIDRHIESFPPTFPIPASLAQSWIRADPNDEDNAREAIAIVYMDTADRVATIPSRNAKDDQPYLDVLFTDNTTRSYRIRDDATVYRPLTTTSNLVVSDGFARRVFMHAQLDSLAKNAAVHSARMRFHIVPNTFLPADTLVTSETLVLYIPDSTDPSRAEFKTGQRVIEQPVRSDATIVEFPMANAIFLVLQGTLKNNGFAIRFKDENTQFRQVELYGSAAADSLRPRVFVTSSTPAVFH